MKVRLEDNNRVLKLRLESEEDLWLLSTIVREGDVIYSRTSRELKTGSGSKRKPMTLGVEVKKLEYQPFTKRLRLQGVIVSSPKEVDITGLHHTISVEPGMEVAVYREEKWGYETVKRLSDVSRGARVRAVIASIDDEEFTLALLRTYGIEVIVNDELNLPGKNQPDHRERVYEEKLRGYAKKIVETAGSRGVGNIVIVGPAHWKTLLAEKVKDLVGKKPHQSYNLIVDNTSSGGIKGVYESLRREVFQRLLREAIVVEEDRVMREVNRLMSRDPDSVVFGIDRVEKAARYGVVDKVVVSSDMLRHPDPLVRKRVVELLRDAEKHKASVKILESLHPEVRVWIKNLGGLIAVLRYKLRV